MITINDVGTPFDDVDSPTTVATPSCCCCCCCCIASISSATVLAGRLVRKDALESQAAAEAVGRDAPGRGGLIALACMVPIAGMFVALLFGQVLTEELPNSDLAGFAAVIAAVGVGVAVLGALRSTAGATGKRAFGTSAAMLTIFPIAVVVEVFLVLFSVGLFWLTTPLWIVWVVRRTRFEPEGGTPVVPAVSYSPPAPPRGDVAPLPPPPSFPSDGEPR